MKRIGVTHIIDTMQVGGAQRQILNLFQALDQNRFDLRLICLNALGAYGEQLREAGFPTAVIDKGPGIDLAALGRLTDLLRDWQPDIVHSSVFTSNFWGRLAGKRAGVPVLISYEQSTMTVANWKRRVAERYLMRHTYRSLCVSDDLRQQMMQRVGLSSEKVQVLYNAIDTQDFQRRAQSDALSEELPGEAGFRVGVVGRLEYRKDHSMLIRAAARVCAIEPRVVFLLAGDGPDRAALVEEIARHNLQDHFHLLGERQDVAALLGAFDVYALSSITEGLSLSILEAMAAGTAVVATDVGGNPELLDNGKAGLLVPARDEQQMADAILNLLRDDERRDQLAQAASKRVVEFFDIRAVAKKLEAIYVQAIC